MSFDFTPEQDGSLSVQAVGGRALAAMIAADKRGGLDLHECSEILDSVIEFVRLNPDGIPPTTPAAHDALAQAAKCIVQACREHFPGADQALQQSMCMAEELGEFQGAARRYLGLARREGSFDELSDELADVVITAYSVAEVFGVTIDELSNAAESYDPEDAVWELMVQGASVIKELDFRMGSPVDSRSDLGNALSSLVFLARHVGTVMEIDLNDRIEKKHQKIFSRGWRDGATSRPVAVLRPHE